MLKVPPSFLSKIGQGAISILRNRGSEKFPKSITKLLTVNMITCYDPNIWSQPSKIVNIYTRYTWYICWQRVPRIYEVIHQRVSTYALFLFCVNNVVWNARKQILRISEKIWHMKIFLRLYRAENTKLPYWAETRSIGPKTCFSTWQELDLLSIDGIFYALLLSRNLNHQAELSGLRNLIQVVENISFGAKSRKWSEPCNSLIINFFSLRHLPYNTT